MISIHYEELNDQDDAADYCHDMKKQYKLLIYGC